MEQWTPPASQASDGQNYGPDRGPDHGPDHGPDRCQNYGPDYEPITPPRPRSRRLGHAIGHWVGLAIASLSLLQLGKTLTTTVVIPSFHRQIQIAQRENVELKLKAMSQAQQVYFLDHGTFSPGLAASTWAWRPKPNIFTTTSNPGRACAPGERPQLKVQIQTQLKVQIQT